MSREIKFKGWNRESKMMYAPFDLHEMLTDPFDTGGSFPSSFLFLEWTGLNEHCNDDTALNKEIYEGDIIEFINGEMLSVEWNDDTCKFQYSDGTDINDHERYGVYKKILGNIYENPELLNDKSNETTTQH